MITYERAKKVPSAFRSLTGLNVAQFEALYSDYVTAHERLRKDSTLRRTGGPRVIRAGSGRLYTHDQRTRLLLTLMWLKVYPTYEVLGFFFGLHKSNAWRTVDEVLKALETLSTFSYERPEKERRQIHTAEAVMDLFPSVKLVIDAKEQRIQRPKGYDNQKPYYSGKKKTHTLKTQVGVAPDGTIQAVSGSYCGATSDITVLRDTHLLDQVRPRSQTDKEQDKEAVMMDKGYVGIRNDYPDHTVLLPFKAQRGRPLTETEQQANALLSSYRIVVEHTNAQLNHFQVLAQTLRKARPRHTRIVRVVAALVNRRIKDNPLKTYTTV